MAQPSKLDGQTVCITGGSHGIGLEIAKELLQKGSVVYTLGRSPSEIAHPQLHHIQCDLEQGIPDSIKSIHFDILVLNIGYNPGRACFNDLSHEDVIRSIHLNVLTHVEFAHHFSSSRIVFIGSVISMVAMPKHALYSASKAFLSTFNEALTREGRDTYIVMPYKVNTGFFNEMKDVGTIDKKVLARVVVQDIESGRKKRIIPCIFGILPFLHALFPNFLVNWLIRMVEKVLF